ncbi:MAG TPA: clostripain-related cysteine peptidase [Pyrinomonadaceae bacterium]|nr:clostripain-related cysteine peptidase [Pyrinomonadaceae bacterium]
MAEGLDSTQGKKKWCVMVYLAADVDLESAALADLEQMKTAGSSSEVDLLAQLNPGGSRVVRRFHLQKGTYLQEDRVPQMNEKGEEVVVHNTNAKQDLLDFIAWCAKQSQAEQYALVLWGHARGWKADAVNPCDTAGAVEVQKLLEEAVAASDPSFPITPASFPTTLVNGETGFLTNADLTDVLAKACVTLGRKKIDILGLDACMMAMAEICYQVYESVDYLVACEDTIPDESWPYDSILELLVKHADQMKPEDFARAIVWKVIHDFGRKKKYVTQSIFQLGPDNQVPLSNFTGAVTRLVEALLGEMHEFEVRWAIMIARTHVQSYYIREYVDLYDFCRLLSINCNNRWVLNACQGVMDAIGGSRSQNGNGPASKLIVDYGIYGYPLKRSFGVSVYFPCVTPIPACYPQLEFCKQTRWHKFLHAFLNSPKGKPALEEKPVDAVIKPASPKEPASTSKEPSKAPEIELAVAGVGDAAVAARLSPEVDSDALDIDPAVSPMIVAADSSNTNGGIKTTHSDEIKTTYGDVIKTTHGDPIKAPTLPVWILPNPSRFKSLVTGGTKKEQEQREPKRQCNCGSH